MLRDKIGSTESGGRRIIQEESGLPITIGLKKKNPFLQEGCQYNNPECLASGDGDCGRMGIVYAIRCITCKRDIDPIIKESLQKPGGVKTHHYLGMTACSIHNRMLSHRKGHLRGDPGNVLVIHDKVIGTITILQF